MDISKTMNNMLGKIQNGMCRLSMNGGIAVKTSNGYKSYNVKTGRLVNCSNFVFDVGQELFFVIPTNKVAKGDIILVSGKPRCVTNVDKNQITAINYEDSTVETIIPERHIFMGNTYFYGKIVSMFGNSIGKGKGGTKNIIKYMALSEMMKGTAGGNTGTDPTNMWSLMMMSGGVNMFEGLFDFDFDEDEEESEDEE